MTNEELKKKIKEILRKRMTELLGSCHTDEIPLTEEGAEAILFYADEFADALIAAGIGDVKEAEHRAFVAERALKNMAADYWGVECFCHGCSESRCRESCGEKYLVYDEEDAVSCLFKNFLEQAEKELAEERNVKN